MKNKGIFIEWVGIIRCVVSNIMIVLKVKDIITVLKYKCSLKY